MVAVYEFADCLGAVVGKWDVGVVGCRCTGLWAVSEAAVGRMFVCGLGVVKILAKGSGVGDYGNWLELVVAFGAWGSCRI